MSCKVGLRKTPDILEKYNEVISQQVKDGIVEQVSDLEPASKIHYLPHRAVIRENAETTKLRLVYDASCRDKTGVSLNDCLHVGPALTPLIFDVLLRFRANPVALVSDIAQTVLNIQVHPEDRDCLRLYLVFRWSSLDASLHHFSLMLCCNIILGSMRKKTQHL